MSEGKAVWWQEMTAEAVVAHAKKDDIAILPLGAIEQHGPHCPCGDDSYNAIGMAEHISRETKRTGARKIDGQIQAGDAVRI